MVDERNGFEVAVIGMAGRFPGARDVEAFWQNLRGGVESISFFDDAEMLAAGVEAERLKIPNLVKAGGVLDDIELFDASFFGFSPREAEIIDPQQRFFLECAWEALENSGYDPETYRDAIGVYAGVSMSGYLLNIFSNPELYKAADSLQLALGNDKDYIATRVAYKLNLRGPAITVQSACSTSLVAAHLACQNLIAGLCDIALAGGVTIFVPQKNGFIYHEGGIVAPDGHTRAFDAKAQGCMGGSGVGVVVLKRLEDALADGDTIQAVIKGGAVNNDGAVKVGYTAPSVEGQARVIRAAHSLSEVAPETITYIETHGTATALGDPIEVAALKQAFQGATQKRNFCALGAVKTNVGHLDSAAGVAGLIKTILALKHREIPPSLHFEEPNPQIDFANSPFYVNNILREWETPEDDAPRRAGVSSFGIGGTNAHLILEEAPPVEASAETRPAQLLLLSARTETALEAATANLAAHLKGRNDIELADVAYTLQVGRKGFKYRRAVLCRDLAEAVEVLETRDPQRFSTNDGEAQDTPVVFMFPGQGSQYVNMGLELYRTETVFREQVDLCSELLKPQLGFDLRSVLYPSETEAEQSAQRLKQTLLTQISLFVVEYALAKLWMGWGIEPHAMIGHSLGEYVAASLAGVFSLEDALRLVVMRGRLMQQLPSGSMLAVPLAEGELLPLLSGTPLSLAAVNGPALSVVSGPHEAVEKLARQLNAQGVDYRELNTSHAFHSEMMEPVLKPFAEQLSMLRLQPPSIPYISNVTGDWITKEEATDPQYWATHLRRTVRFSDGLHTLLSSPQRAVMLEIGPGDTLSTLARRHPLKADGQALLTSLRRPHDRQSDVVFLLRTVGQLWLEGKQFDWSKFYAHERRRRIPLPTYPFERRRYWVERQQLPEAGGNRRQRSLRKKEEIADWFYVPVWKQSVPPLEYQDETEAGHASRWLVFEDECGLGEQLAARLEGEGSETIRVRQGTRFLKTGERAYTIDPRNREHYDALFREIQTAGEFPHRLLHMWSVTPEHLSGVADGEDLLELGFYSLLFLTQALGEQVLAATLGTSEMDEPFRITIIANDMQPVTGAENALPEKATLLGPCKVIPQEYPHVNCRIIDVKLDGGPADTETKLVDQLLAELRTEQAETLVAYRGPQRWVQGFEPLRLADKTERPYRLRDGGVYLITGGMGGLGLEMAEYLARTVKARLALIGRSAFPARAEWNEWLATHDEQDAVSQKIKRVMSLEELGAQVLVLSADIADRIQLEAALDEVSRQLGEVNGIIHSAGVAPSSLIQRKTREMAAAVLAPKVRATRLLDSFVQKTRPDFFLLCSSLRALVGGPGTIDYCAANAFLDAFARSRAQDAATTTISVNWDGWAQAGMSLNVGAQAILEAEQNDEGMSNEEGIAAFSRILRSSLPQIVVSTSDLQAVLEQEQSSTAANVLGQLQQTRAAASAHPRPHLKNSYVAPRDAVEQTLADIWQELLGIEGIGIHDNFFELGGDSVISIRIIARANQARIHLTPKQVFEHQTIAELAAAAGEDATILKAEQGIVTGPAPLTPTQHWFFEGNPLGPNHLNQAVLLETRQRLNYDLLEQATRALLRHHDVLRHRFKRSDAGWQQFCIAPDEQSVCTLVDLSAVAPGERREAIESRAAELQASLHLTEGPMMRVALFDLGPDEPGRLLIIIHHLVIDALAWRILLEDLETAYHQLSAGQPVRLPFKTTSYKQWAERLVQYAQSGEAEKELDYWLAAPREDVAALPVDFPGGANSIASLRIVSASLTEEETTALLQEVPMVYQTQINDALLTALSETFAKWTGNRLLLIDLEGHGRDPDVSDVDLSRTLGWFTSIYPVLLATEETGDHGEALKAIKEQLRCIPQGGLGYGVLRYMGREEVSKKLLALPQPDINFLYLGQMDQVLSGSSPFGPAAESGGPTRGMETVRRYPLEVVGNVAGGRLLVAWTYSENLHRAETIEALAEGYINELRALIAHCQSRDEKGYTASDFADFDWSPDDLENIISKISKSIGTN